MANPMFYFYPMPSGNHLVTIDIGEGLGELFSVFDFNVNDGIGLVQMLTRHGAPLSRLYRSGVIPLFK